MKHYDYLTKDLNGRLLLQNYKVFATNHRYLVLFLLVFLVIFVFVGMVMIELRMQCQKTENDVNFLPIFVISMVGITTLLLLIPCFLCCVPFCRKKVYYTCMFVHLTNVKELFWSHPSVLYLAKCFWIHKNWTFMKDKCKNFNKNMISIPGNMKHNFCVFVAFLVISWHHPTT